MLYSQGKSLVKPAIDKAITRALTLYEHSAHRKSKLMLLLTDGEDFSLDLAAAKAAAKKEGIHMCGLGIGTPAGAPIPIIDHTGAQVGHESDEQGNPVLSVLNEAGLQDICNDLGGQYVRAGMDERDLDTIATFIDRFEKEEFGEKAFSLFEERYPLFLGISAVLLALEWIL